MEKSKKLFVIGKRPTRTMIIVTAVLAIIAGLEAGFYLCKLCKVEDYKISAPIVILATAAIFFLIYVPTIANCIKHWDISEKYIELYRVNKYGTQWKYVYGILIGKEEKFADKIELSEIKSIKLYWTTMFSYMVMMMHPIFFRVTLKDGTVIKFLSLVTSNDKNYVAAVKHLKEKCNIEIEDEHDLLSVIEDPNRSLNEYIDEIERASVKAKR
ncbi:hypothetical protein [Clostridium cellulovorans]|uniref:Transmembrane protein n=1 Tax=Clostridium cellulovorans (strain ATCC 35296 / DSM 3052 / OCM 3 / 743B) TaxID=573061 RepID=D9STZ5_CLOC7|nr:hypothetical protein [Clostridium cellulovorans]ADL50833.1 hypothetical protein Clocel_1074 [Clostridium cellulovorans 743B]